MLHHLLYDEVNDLSKLDAGFSLLQNLLPDCQFGGRHKNLPSEIQRMSRIFDQVAGELCDSGLGRFHEGLCKLD